MQQFNIADLLPMLPWEGPPLPRFLGLVWPWLGQQDSLPLASPTKGYITAIEETEKALVPQQPLASYQNEEIWEISWTPDGLPSTIKVTRHAIKS